MKKCSVEGCERKVSWGGYCGRHVHRVRTHGTPYAYSPYEPNEIVFYDDGTAGIILKSKYGEYRATAIVDKESLPIIKKHKWHFKSDGYACTHVRVNGAYFGKRMHNILTGHEKDVDHIDNDKLNNRMSNLRKCSSKENKRNCPVRCDNKSGVTGVYWRDDSKKWRVYIKYEDKKTNIGHFDNKDDAIRARVQAEMKYFGEFAPQVEKYKHLLEGVAI